MRAATPELVVRHRFTPDAEMLAAVLENRYQLGLIALRPDANRLAAHHFTEEPLELAPHAMQRLQQPDRPDSGAGGGLGFTQIPRFARQAFACQDALRVIRCTTQIVDTVWLIHCAEWPLSARAQHAINFLLQRIGNKEP